MLGVAFAATIGGMGSLIGTPPNALFAAYAAEVHGTRIGFAEWALIGIPVSLTLLIAAWGVLAIFAGGTCGHDPRSSLGALPPRSAEASQLIIFRRSSLFG